MNAERLLELYDRVAEAPDAVARLRRFVLDLAVRGKLVEQDPADEPAPELLKRIAARKARLMETGDIGKQAPLTSICADDQPFRLPRLWEWVPATYPAYLRSDLGKKVKTKEVLESGLYPVVDQGKVLVRGFCDDEEKVVRVDRPLIVFGDHTRETKLIDFDFVVGADGVKILQPVAVSEKYYFLALQWLPLENRGYGRHFKLLKASLLPLPPLAEQHRIVEKVDELMALCDRLEEARTTREATRDRLTTASLARLTATDTDQQTFRSHARFALDAFPALTTRPDQIKALRQTILNLAVRGKLVEQDPADEPASELLKRIAAEKTRLVTAKLIRKPKALKPISASEYPTEIPPSWEVHRLGNLSAVITKGSTPTSYGHEFTGSGVNFLKVESIVDGRIDPSSIRSFIGQKTHNFLARSQLEAGDILFSIAGSIGTCAFVTPEIIPANTNQALAIVRGTSLVFDPDFLILLLRSFVSDAVKEKARGGAMNNVSLTDLQNLIVPLPPLAEQRRIVAALDELMALCDRLEQALSGANDRRRGLLDALLKEALERAKGELEVA